MKAVKIEWIDSCTSNHEWLLKSDIDNWEDVEPIYITTYGVLVKEEEEYIVIAQNYGTNPEQVSNLTSIPKGCIKNIIDI